MDEERQNPPLLRSFQRITRARALLLAFLAGLLSALGFQPVATVAGPILGMALLLLLLHARPGRSAFLPGFAFGLGQFVPGLWWIAEAFTHQAAMPAALGYGAVFLLSLYLALYPAVAAFLARRLSCRVVPLALAFAGLFTLTEVLRGLLLSGFPWNPLGVSFLQLAGVARLAALVGSNGLSALAVLCGGSLAALVAGRGEHGRLALVALFPLLLFLGVLIPKVEKPLPPATATRLLLVQTGVGIDDKYRPGGEEKALADTLAATRKALAASGAGSPPAAVIWPEATIEEPLEEEPDLARLLTAGFPDGTLLLTGGVGFVRDGAGAITAATNSLYALSSAGRILARYDKAHLVPFGEYLPLRAVLAPLGLARVVPGSIDFRPGPGPRTLHLPGLPAVGPDICYEIIFPGAIVDERDRPAFILTISNDAWFGRSGPPQHFAQARLRAIEEGLPVVRVTPTGISGVIDARGDVVATIPGTGSGVLNMALPAAREATLFARFGLVAPVLLGMALVLMALVARRRRAV